jgi:hypothetical protein
MWAGNLGYIFIDRWVGAFFAASWTWLLGMVLVLCLLSRRPFDQRFRPLVWAVVAIMVLMLLSNMIRGPSLQHEHPWFPEPSVGSK